MDNYTFTVSYRYFDERDYRLYAVGIRTSQQLSDVVSDVALLAEVEDIKIGVSYNDEVDFKVFTP